MSGLAAGQAGSFRRVAGVAGATGALVVAVLALHWYILVTSFAAPGTFVRLGIPFRHCGLDVRGIYRAGALARNGGMIYSTYESGYRIPGDMSAPPFRYPPAAAYTVGLALALFDRNDAHAVWIVVVQLLLVANALLLARLVPDRRRLCVLLGIWLLVPPVFVDLWLGQFSLVTALLFFWALLAWGWHRREEALVAPSAKSWGTALWGAAVLLKGMPLVYGLALWKSPKSSQAVIRVFALLLLTTGAYFGLYPADVMNFVELNGDASQAWYMPSNEGLWNVLGRLAGESDGTRQRLASLGLSAVVGTVALWAARAAGSAQRPWLLGALTCAFLLTFKEVWNHHFCFLLPFASFLCLTRNTVSESHERVPTAGSPLQYAMAWGLLLWLILPNIVWGSGLRLLGLPAALFWRPVPTLLLFLLCAWICTRAEESQWASSKDTRSSRAGVSGPGETNSPVRP